MFALPVVWQEVGRPQRKAIVIPLLIYALVFRLVPVECGASFLEPIDNENPNCKKSTHSLRFQTCASDDDDDDGRPFRLRLHLRPLLLRPLPPRFQNPPHQRLPHQLCLHHR